jgi:hypothetical protein
MMIHTIQTPADLEWTLDARLCRFNCWVPPPGPPETVAIEQIIDHAFAERAKARHPGGEPEMRLSADAALTDWLDALVEPLERLTDQGYQLVAVLSGRLPRPADAGLEMADYLVAPDPCYFRPAGSEFTAPIHALGSDCSVGHAQIVGEEPQVNVRTFEIWMSPESVVRDFELSVPWCPRCSPEVDSGGLAAS